MLDGNLLHENIVTGFADVTFTASTGETTLLRVSFVAERIADTWSIRHYHAANLSGPREPGQPSAR